MRKIIAVILCLVMALGLVACNQPAANNEGDGEKEVKKLAFKDSIGTELGSVHVETEGVDYSAMKIGFIHISDPSDMGYTYNHNNGTEKMKTSRSSTSSTFLKTMRRLFRRPTSSSRMAAT